MFSYLTLLTATIHLAAAATLPRNTNTSVWQAANFKSLITFGDSYTDENRLNYIALHNGSYPPPGTILPESFATAGGGRTWPRYAAQYAGSSSLSTWEPNLQLYDYAVSGAVCSNSITPRYFAAIDAPFPAVAEYELPAYINDTTAVRTNTSEPYFTPPLSPSTAVYALWIGTNDLGVDAFITASNLPNTTLLTYLSCVLDSLDTLYTTGARTFILMTPLPLYLAPLYASPSILPNGVSPQYWPDKNTTANTTAIASTMQEYTDLLTELYRTKIPLEKLTNNRWPDADIAIFNTNALFKDIHANPDMYLNGTTAANVTGYHKHCTPDDTGAGSVCFLADEDVNGGKGEPDAWMWYDELHPSEQVDRVVAREFLSVLGGEGRWGEYW